MPLDKNEALRHVFAAVLFSTPRISEWWRTEAPETLTPWSLLSYPIKVCLLNLGLGVAFPRRWPTGLGTAANVLIRFWNKSEDFIN
jgi:hypothetical protein